MRTQRHDAKTEAEVQTLLDELGVKPDRIEPSIWFDGIHRGQRSVAHLCIFMRGKQLVVIATERSDNPGASITNAAENLWRYVAMSYDWPYEDMIAIEHYVKDRYGDSRAQIPRQLDRVHLESAIRWSPLTIEQFREFVRA